MLNGEEERLLKEIILECPDGKYGVITADDLGVDSETLLSTVKKLHENGYVSVKFYGDGVVFACPLPLGRTYAEKNEEEKAERNTLRSALTHAVRYPAFFGALVGGLIVGLLNLIFRVVGLC